MRPLPGLSFCDRFLGIDWRPIPSGGFCDLFVTPTNKSRKPPLGIGRQSMPRKRSQKDSPENGRITEFLGKTYVKPQRRPENGQRFMPAFRPRKYRHFCIFRIRDFQKHDMGQSEIGRNLATDFQASWLPSCDSRAADFRSVWLGSWWAGCVVEWLAGRLDGWMAGC